MRKDGQSPTKKKNYCRIELNLRGCKKKKRETQVCVNKAMEKKQSLCGGNTTFASVLSTAPLPLPSLSQRYLKRLKQSALPQRQMRLPLQKADP
jgi:hypothetical protein